MGLKDEVNQILKQVLMANEAVASSNGVVEVVGSGKHDAIPAAREVAQVLAQRGIRAHQSSDGGFSRSLGCWVIKLTISRTGG